MFQSVVTHELVLPPSGAWIIEVIARCAVAQKYTAEQTMDCFLRFFVLWTPRRLVSLKLLCIARLWPRVLGVCVRMRVCVRVCVGV